MTVYTQLRINDAHRMFWIFSSWCVKGGLGACNSRLGTPRRGETAGMEGLFWYSSYVYLWCGRSRGKRVGWGEEGGGGVWGRNDRKDDESKYKHRRTRAPRAEAGVVIPTVTLGKSVKVDVFACICIPGGCSPVISRTVRNTLSFSGSRGSILW